MTTLYLLSEYKDKEVAASPYNIADQKYYSFSKRGDDLLQCYISPDIGLFIKNLTTGKTERYHTESNIKNVKYVYLNTHYCLYLNAINNKYIKYFNATSNEYEVKKLDINTFDYHLVDDSSKVFIFYLYNKQVYLLSSEDNFTSLKTISNKVIDKQKLSRVYKNTENEIVLIFTITDPTLITTNNDLGSTAQSMIIEYSIPLSEFTEVVK